MAVADEKDRLAPQLEEARWRNRQLEKDNQQLQEASSAAEQVCMLILAACDHADSNAFLRANMHLLSC